MSGNADALSSLLCKDVPVPSYTSAERVTLSQLQKVWTALVIGGGAVHGTLLAAAMTQLFPHDAEFHAWRRYTLTEVAGTSIGAVLCVGYALGLTPRVMLQEMLNIPWARMVDPSGSALSTGSLSDGAVLDMHIVHTMRRFGLDTTVTMAQLEERCGVRVNIAVNVLTQAGGMDLEVWSGTNHAAQCTVFTALRATVSLPGLFPCAVDMWDRMLVDGGVMCNVPMHVVAQNNALLLRSTGTSQDRPGLPLLRSHAATDRSPWTAWFNLTRSVVSGVRTAAERQAASSARFSCEVWSSSLSPLDVNAGPRAMLRGARDGAWCARMYVMAWTRVLLGIGRGALQ